MSLRDLVSGGDVCTPSDVGGPSNAVGTLTNALLGKSKVQDSVLELPSIQGGRPHPGSIPEEISIAQVAHAAAHGDLPRIPGLSHPLQGPLMYNKQLGNVGPSTVFQEYDAIYNQQRILPPAGPLMDVSIILDESFKAFMRCAESGLPYTPAPLPPINLPIEDQHQIRNRATVMARQLFADKGPAFAEQQVYNFLASLGIEPSQLAIPPQPHPEWGGVWDSQHGMAAQMESVWQESKSMSSHPHPSEGWAADFSHAQGTNNWGREFEKASISGPAAGVDTGASAWVSDFQKETEAQAAAATSQSAHTGSKSAEDMSKALIEQMSNDPDPKFRNSKFLQFVSKMSRGELVIQGNEVVEVDPVANSWTNQFENSASQQAPQQSWAKEFEDVQQRGSTSEQWVKDFGSLEGGWLHDNEVEEWVDAYTQGVGNHVQDRKYTFSKSNPFQGDPQALLKGRQFFGKGVLTEAALAVEAEVQQNPDNAEAWRLLGVIHAENDDDYSAISAFEKAKELDPANLEVLLSLGVSYANELDEVQVVNSMMTWLKHHPDHKEAAEATPPPPGTDPSQELSHAVRTFENAAVAHSQDPDVFSSLGVLQHLSRDYESAVSSFERALDLQGNNYSLWNKLGATLANSGKSNAALQAYQKALDIKPNYMRGWANLGISYANLGDYMSSLKYYLRALSLNPKAESVWGFLRTSLLCAGHTDLMALVDSKDLEGITSRLGLPVNT